MKSVLKHSISLILLLCSCTSSSQSFSETYAQKCKEFEESIERDKYCDIDFLGDSITQGWPVEAYFKEFKVANRGISGDTTDMLLTRMEVSSTLLEPKIINLLIGTNNLETCMNNYEAILQGFKLTLPDTKVAVVSILPRRGQTYCKKIKENNALIKELAIKYDYTYVDLYDSFTKNGEYTINNHYFLDGLHPSENGYQLLTDTLKPLFTSWLKS